MRLISEKMRIARKDYYCDATNFILERSLDYEDLEEQEWAAIERGRGGIKKGEKYLCQTIAGSDGIYMFRAIHEIHAIALKHNLYDENS